MLMSLVPIALMMAAVQVAPAADAAEAGITAAMTDSAAGWSRGDMPRFLAIYSDDAVFVTKDGLVRGKAAIAARYAKNYGTDTAARGRLTFQMLGFRRIDATHQMLWARWNLAYPGGKTAGGMTSLLFERQAGGWKIVSDHSS